MDKGKKVTTAIKKYYFWILFAITVLGGLVLWQTAAADWSDKLENETKNRKKAREQVQTVASDGEPHNEKTVDKIREVHGLTSKQVLVAWEKLYTEQTKLNPWPSKLGPKFLSIIESLKPEDPIPADECYNYAVFIKDYVPQLKLLVNMRMTRQEAEELSAPPDKKPKKPARKTAATATADAGAAAIAAGADDKSQELVGVVWWDDYAKVEDRYYRWQTTPTSQEVRLAQEDLWVIEALLRIIRDTNEGANEFNAPIKRIISLSIAEEAAAAFAAAQNRVLGGFTGMGAGRPSMEGESPSSYPGSYPGTGPRSPGPSGSMPSSYPSGSGSSGSGSPPMTTSGGTSMGSASSGPSSGAGMGPTGGPSSSDGPSGPMSTYGGGMYGMAQYARYVDQNGRPLAPGAEQPFKEFKMTPVHAVLVMDHRRIPRLLANCANSSMPVEVRRLSLESGAGGGGFQVSGFGGSRISRSDDEGMSGRGMGPSSSSMMRGMGRSGGFGGPSSMYPGGSSGYGSSSSMYPRSPGGYGGSRSYGPSVPRTSTTYPTGGVAGGGDVNLGPYDMTVEIEGIIFIFNPPNVETSASEGTAVPGPTPKAAAEPAAATEPPAAAKAPGAAEPPAAEPPAAEPPAAPGVPPAGGPGAPTPEPAPGPGPSPGSPSPQA